MHRFSIIIFCLSVLAFSCREDNDDLPPVEVRVKEAIDGLRNELIAPPNGWRLEYQPTDESGTFLILMKFSPDGNVNILSDVPDGNGEFFNQTITYRIDNALGLELILETFGVFHHLFELDRATFGAEFEFLFKRKEGQDLIFESLSDFSNPTILTLTPAGPNDASEFARELSQNLVKFKISNPQIFGTITPSQQVILNDRNISVFWNIDLDKRNLVAEFAGIGTTRDQVIANNRVTINKSTKFSYANGQIVLDSPISFVLNGQSNNISSIALSNFSLTGADICPTGTANMEPKYTGQSSNLGAITLVNSFLSTRGIDFTKTVYSVNAQFVFNALGESLLDAGSIGQKFPTASGFIFFYGVPLTDPNIPIYSVGLIMDDGELYVREFQPTNTSINLVQITLLDQFYYTATPPAGTEQNLKDITNEIFAGGEFYAFDLPVNGLKVFRLYNPCNKYEFFLVQ